MARAEGARRHLPGEWPVTLVLVVAAVAMVVIAQGHFKRGSLLFAAAVLFAALLRAVLPTAAAGALVVRGRLLDVLTAAVLGVSVLGLSLIVPPLSR